MEHRDPFRHKLDKNKLEHSILIVDLSQANSLSRVRIQVGVKQNLVQHLNVWLYADYFGCLTKYNHIGL